MRWLRFVVVAITMVAVACGSDGEDKKDATGAAPAAGAATQATGAQPAVPTQAAQPRGELRMGVDFLPANLDPTKSFNLGRLGIGESLTRLTPELKVEPYLAREVTQKDAVTWRVSLRPNAKFHDGSAVDAEAVKTSFARVWQNNATADGLIPKSTTITVVDPATLEFTLPRPDGAFLNNLAAFQFIVHKASGDQVSMTGPYKVTKLTPDESLQLAAFTDYWAGPPPIATINVRLIRDTNARVLALQSGDVDLLVGLPMEMVDGLSGDFERPVIAGLRMQYMVLNHAKPLFQDRAVREAMSLGIDRATLNKVGFDGQSKPAVSLFPSVSGVEVVQAQGTDVARARQLLDQAGWVTGGDGVRAKGGQRLAFTLFTYPQRADLTPMAVSIQAQLKPLGFDVRLETVQDIMKSMEGDFDAAMYSIGTMPTGDPYYAFATTLVTKGQFNFGRFSSAQLDALAQQLAGESDASKRQALSRQMQEVVKAEVPNLYLVASPLAYAYRKGKVKNLTLHPNDVYLIDNKLAVQ